MDFSLFYFANDSTMDSANRYRLLLEGARFADRNGFTAVWTPERHFHPFGGTYPNPSVTSAAVAAVTTTVGIRAGSVVAPLHSPIRMAEEWSMVDNLSGGRAGVSFASGWNAIDFAIQPDRYAERQSLLYQNVDQVRRLWRGERMSVVDGDGKQTEIAVYPPPIQAELPVWITSAGSMETVRSAGRIGAGLLTHLLGKSFDQLAERIAAYRAAVGESAAGRSGWPGHVVLMLHTYLGEDDDAIKEQVREPLSDYLRSALSLQMTGARRMDPAKMQPRDVDTLVRRSFDRYYAEGGLLGDVGKAERLVTRLADIGVDEIACLIDFGVPVDATLAALESLDQLRVRMDTRIPTGRP